MATVNTFWTTISFQVSRKNPTESDAGVFPSRTIHNVKQRAIGRILKRIFRRPQYAMDEYDHTSNNQGNEQFHPKMRPEQSAQSADGEESDDDSLIDVVIQDGEGLVAGEDQVYPGGEEAEEED